MNLLFGLLVVLFVLSGNAQNWGPPNTQPATCERYCFLSIMPLLEHCKKLQDEIKILKHEAENKCDSTIENMFNSQDEKTKLHYFNIRLIAAGMEQNLSSLNEKIEEYLPQRIDEVIGFHTKIGSKYYHFETLEKVNWFEAVNKCLERGGHLTSIKNEDEFNGIKEKLQENENYWIDINDLADEGEFISIATGRKPSYLNWHANEPNNQNNNEHCGDLWYKQKVHLMNDAKCDEKNLFICEPKHQVK
ncbi:C-type lectin domain family 4 member K-like [Drosophila nasuta]|uniref:C-type lectin domain family 4 member K-like n=1 Tax=Drosophila nasuta TaxID=42062 RepID=UPI00295EB7D4|nr:C-type lectin domain family 4 member K-like [Drosophila nasuta]